MKTTSISMKRTATMALALALAGFVIAPMTTRAQVQGGRGASSLMKLSQIKTTEDVDKVAPGDLMVMSCPKCKDTWVKVVEPSFKGGRATQPSASGERSVKEHLCPGCGSKRVTTGHGKDAITQIVHTCSQCGSEDVTCCVMKQGEGPTHGMTK